MVKIKEYQFANLLDDYDDVLKRCNLIIKVSECFSFIPKTQITINSKSLIYKQELIQKKSWRNQSNVKKLQLLKTFAENMDKLNKAHFVHGDINLNNILYDGQKLNLIDLEPSFRQRKYGKKVVMSAVPLRSLNDMQNKKLSSETDKIGFYLLCQNIFDISSNIKNTKDIMQRRSNGFEFLPIKEYEFMDLNFVEIFVLFKQAQSTEKNENNK